MKNYSPKNKVMWDLWFIKDKNTYHIFYLQAKRSKDPEERHDANVSIGHAISEDLINWKEIGTALKPGKKGEWDDLALWTGSTIKKNNMYYMFYTGRKKGKNKDVQKIGVATSKDLINWRKHPNNPIIEADNKYYDSDFSKNKIVWYDYSGRKRIGKIGAWRDPYMFKDPKSGKYYMTISGRKKTKERMYNACIALAESKDLISWKLLPPILSPGKYDEMEVSQIIYHNKKYYLFFGVAWRGLYESKWRKSVGSHTGLHCYFSDNLKGLYKPINNNGVVLDRASDIYGQRIIHKKGKEFIAIGWKNDKGKFIGKISDPKTLIIDNEKISIE